MYPAMHSGYAYSPFYGLLDFIGHVLIVVLIVWFVLMLFRRSRRGGRMHLHEMWHSHSALSILNERFAKGEIDTKEYEERKKVLME